jgi:hypothetical protein
MDFGGALMAVDPIAARSFWSQSLAIAFIIPFTVAGRWFGFDPSLSGRQYRAPLACLAPAQRQVESIGAMVIG